MTRDVPTTQQVAQKMIAGEVLTLPELKCAVARHIYNLQHHPQSAEEWTALYQYHVDSHYEDEKIHGFLCLEHDNKYFLNEDGEKTECLWGLHLDELNPEYLTPGNRLLLKVRLGKEDYHHA